MKVESKLKEMGIVLPDPLKPLGRYVPAIRVGAWVYVSGMVSMQDGKLKHKGKVGRELTLEQGYEATRISAINALAAVRSVIGDLDKVERIVKVVGFVNSSHDFVAHPKVVNGASDLFGEVFGEIGVAARSAVGVSGLPEDSPVELEMIIKIRE